MGIQRGIDMSISTKRRHEEFSETLRKNIARDLWNDERVMRDSSLVHAVDHDVLAKCRLSRYGQQSKLVSGFMHRTEDYNDMQKVKDEFRPADKNIMARDFDLDQNVALIFFNAYGEGFYGEPFPSKDDHYTCRGCGLKMMMSLKTLPERCPTCGRETPLGQLYKDKVLKR